MRHCLCLGVAAALAFCLISSRRACGSDFAYDGYIPKVTLNDQCHDLQVSLYPDMYRRRSIQADISWVTENDRELQDFWQQKGDTVLHLLRELSGIEWQEPALCIYLVRYYPSPGSPDPLVVALGGIGGDYGLEAAPRDTALFLNVMFQLSRRLLGQPGTVARSDLEFHPLMQAGPFRRDNLAMLLALHVAEQVLGVGPAYAAFNSAFWVNHMPGRVYFDNFLLGRWRLTTDSTLADWVAAEPYNSELVLATRPLRPQSETGGARLMAGGVPPSGSLGISVSMDADNRLVINQIDTLRLAYGCGLRRGDCVFSVDHHRPASQRELIERIVAGLDEKGNVALEVIRSGQATLVVIRGQENAAGEWHNTVHGTDSTAIFPPTPSP